MPRRFVRGALILGLTLTPAACDAPRAQGGPAPSSSPEAEREQRAARAAEAEAAARRAAEEAAARQARRRFLALWLSAQQVGEGGWARPELFTWTTAEQIEELRAGAPLLSRSRTSDGRASAFDQALEGDPHPLAQRLHRPPFNVQRFAWANPWATARGWGGQGYGDRLLRLRLREGAWVARFDPSAPEGERWSAVTLEGAPVPAEALAASPERVAAVYHLGRSPEEPAVIFREYVLVNEAQIERAEVGTEALRVRLGEDAGMLLQLAEEELAGEEPAEGGFLEALGARWRSAPGEGEPSLLDLYLGTLAFGDPLYRPTPANLRALSQVLTGARAPSAEGPYLREVDAAAVEASRGRPPRARPTPRPSPVRDATFASPRSWDRTL